MGANTKATGRGASKASKAKARSRDTFWPVSKTNAKYNASLKVELTNPVPSKVAVPDKCEID